MNQLKDKARELEVVATLCKVDAKEVLEDLASSVEKTNKEAASPNSNEKTIESYLLWWDSFLKEWSRRCFIRWIDKHKDSKDYELMKNEWYIFEILWETGSDLVRISRSNEFKDSVTKVIAREKPSQDDENKIWQWISSFNETAQKAIDMYKGIQRQTFEQVFEELKDYDKASLLGKLKRLLSK